MEEQPSNVNSIGSNILFCNIQGLYNTSDLTKPNILLDLATSNDVFCICLCESHLSDNVQDSELISSGWNIIRSDRKERIGGGVAIYLDERIPISEKLSFSNSMCETTGVFLPLSDLIIITVYRPPSCVPDKLEECFNVISKWLKNIVNTTGKTPKIFINGDFNFPSMSNWNDTITTKFLDTLIDSYDNGKSLSVLNKQIKILYDFIEEWLLFQKIHENTRKNNILDLFFTNDEDSVINTEIINNVSFSDHNLVKLYTDLNFSNKEACVEDYPYSTNIPRYNLLEGSDSEWNNLNSFYSDINWSEVFNTVNVNRDILTQNVDLFIKGVENGVEKSFNQRVDEKRCSKSDGTAFRSKNLIPRDVRKLFKAKCKASKHMKTVTSVNRCLALRKRIHDLDNQIRLSYEQRKSLRNKKSLKKQKTTKMFYLNILKNAKKLKPKLDLF